MGLGLEKGEAAAFTPYNQFGVKVGFSRSEEARYVKYGTLGMNAPTEEMEVKGQLVAATSVSTGFKSTMCKMDLENPGPFWDQNQKATTKKSRYGNQYWFLSGF